MRLLKITAADFGRGDVGGNRQHRHVIAVAVEEAVDQVQVTRPAGSGADGQLTRKLCFSTCGERGNLFMAGRHPFDGLHLVEAVAESVQGIAGDAPDTFYASLFERFRYICSHGLFHGCPSPFCDNAYKLRRKSPYCPSDPPN